VCPLIDGARGQEHDLFNDQAVSAVRYQISPETCRYRNFNLWGTAGADYQPGPVTDGDAVKRLFALEVSLRIPVRDIEQMASPRTGVSIDVPWVRIPSLKALPSRPIRPPRLPARNSCWVGRWGENRVTRSANR